MGIVLRQGHFYEFHRRRVTSRPGQPITFTEEAEIGPEIPQPEARRQVTNGKDVYTPTRAEAYSLALQVSPGTPVEEMPTNERHWPHFHPGGIHPVFDQDQPGRPRATAGFGHIFFGVRGHGFRPRG